MSILLSICLSSLKLKSLEAIIIKSSSLQLRIHKKNFLYGSINNILITIEISISFAQVQKIINFENWIIVVLYFQSQFDSFKVTYNNGHDCNFNVLSMGLSELIAREWIYEYVPFKTLYKGIIPDAESSKNNYVLRAFSAYIKVLLTWKKF